MQQQIFRQSDEHFEVYTTIFSPQVCRSGTRTGIRDRTSTGIGSRSWSRDVEAEKMEVATQHRSSWQKELDLNQGDLIQVLFKEDEAWWFGRRSDGKEGYFPAACVEPLQGGESSGAPPMVLKRGSVPVASMTEAPPSGGTSIQRLLRRTSLRLDGNLAMAPQGSPSLLHRVLARSRRKSCPHLPHSAPDTGSVNTTFQLD
ncbi:uncharacterized protein ACO6RY_13579 [Pungitius sinensis]